MHVRTNRRLRGNRFELKRGSKNYPEAFLALQNVPETIYGIGNIEAIQEGLAIVGARKATPYGIKCAKRFAKLAAMREIVIISGGARGCDAAAHEAAVEENCPTVVFLGGGCDDVYPPENFDLFQRVINTGGAVLSEQDWTFHPMRYAFRARNRLIAGLAKATLIVEAGLPSGTFSTADEALAANREVLVVPGSITSAQSRGANRLIYQGATPVIDDDSFADQLFSIFGKLKQESAMERKESAKSGNASAAHKNMLKALEAEPLGIEEMRQIAAKHVGPKAATSWLMLWIAECVKVGAIAQYPDGRYGPNPKY